MLLLLITGLIALFSASYTNAMFYKGSATYFIMRQGIFAAIGLAAMIVLSKIPYRMYAGIHNIIMWISVALLILVAIPGIGTSINNARPLAVRLSAVRDRKADGHHLLFLLGGA